ncbi:MAG: pyridoxal-phosphate dependent enzyme [Euryarchaeota archaeon]|nr:pyridoxal-phosphate dependent enzyme [Euryarchaeota archaeon]
MSDLSGRIPTREDIEAAHGRIRPHIHRTPVMTSRSIDGLLGAKLFFKCENLQRCGAFKIRGACNAVFSLSDEEIKNGVATHSSGNHAQALALAAKLRGAKAYVVMPHTSAKVKVDAVRGYGAEITFCGPIGDSRRESLEKVLDRTGAAFVHPYDDPRVIAGQATAAKELLEDVKDLDMVIAPVGGGGLLSGTSLSAKYFSNGVKSWGAEPEGADDAFRSLKEGMLIPQTNPKTIADGLLTSLSPLTFEIIRSNVAGIAIVSEGGIIEAMRHLFQRMKLVVEPSGAVPLGALIERESSFRGKRIGVVLSGGNVDPALVARLR